LLLAVVDAAIVIPRYVMCEHCRLVFPEVDNLDEHVCETAAAAAAGAEMIVESSVKGYQCQYCHKTFAQVACCSWLPALHVVV